MPATGVRPPLLMLVIVRAIAPVAGIPPKIGEARFASPWAISSVLELLRSPMTPSATVAESSDSIVNAYNLTKEFLEKYPDLDGIICCNMSNPVGAGRAVEEAGKAGKVIIVGMDHDERAIKYLRDGIIYALAIQDCYSIGFDTITTAVKIADGILPGSLYPEKKEETTTVFYQKDAASLLRSLYGIME